jgi:hypothetical protein
MSNRLLRLAALPALLALAACSATGAAILRPAPYLEAITEEGLRADVFALAHDSTRGRLVGTLESGKAADWIRARFEALGLEPAARDGTFDDRFDLVWFSLGEGSVLEIAGAGGPRAVGDGWYPLNVAATAGVAGEVVFAGFGIHEPQLDHDDYRGADLAGKIVLVLEREPGADDPASPFDGLVTAEAARDFRKAMAAQSRGAAGILFVRDIHNRPPVEDWASAAANYWPAQRRRIEVFNLRQWVDGIRIPGAFISAELAEALVAGSGESLHQLAMAAEAARGGIRVRELPGSSVTLRTAVDRHYTPARNILGMVRGADPRLRDEAVILLGHFDHNGAAGDTIYNGADDNVSGTAGVMAVAAAYARAAAEGIRPRRSVVFAITDAEERGPLLGAWHLTENPPFPLERTVAALNADMIGRHQEVPLEGGSRFTGLEPQTARSNANAVNVLGYSRTADLVRIVEAANEAIGLDLRFRYDNNESNLLRRSDQWPYLQTGVPALWFHTGLHPDYHTPDDVPERIEFEKMTRIVRLIHQVSWDLANADGRPRLEGMGSRPRS